jgi:flagellar FliJ protein
MKRFKFRLESVLKWRLSLEEICLRDLSECEIRREQAQNELYRVQHEISETIAFCRESLRRKFDPQLAGNYFHYLNRLNRSMEEAVIWLRQREVEVTESRARLIEATRKRKVIEKLKEHAFRKHQAEELRSEINFLDELGTSRFVRDQPGYGEVSG